MSVKRDVRTGRWFFRTVIHFSDGKRRVFGTPGIPGPYHDLSPSKAGAEEAERRAIKAALASKPIVLPRTSVVKKLKMTQTCLDAVWASVYVRVLSATPSNFPAADHGIKAVAAMLTDPSSGRVKTAIAAANNAVLRLVETMANEETP